MSDIKLFRYSSTGAEELVPHCAQIERNLQYLVEKNMECFLGIKFLAHEYRTGKLQRGFIDSLALDENGCPVILEYKRHANENVINQGLYYLGWLMDHQAEFILLVRNRLGEKAASHIEFSASRVLCVASSFSKYDEQAILQINKNIELIRYKFFGDDLLMLELVNSSLATFLTEADKTARETGENEGSSGSIGMPATMQARIRGMNEDTERLYLDLLAFVQSLGDDVSIKFLKHYVALVRLKNFAAVQPLKNSLKLWLNLDPSQLTLEEGFSRDVTSIGHHASGNLELDLGSSQDLQKAIPLLEQAYQQN